MFNTVLNGLPRRISLSHLPFSEIGQYQNSANSVIFRVEHVVQLDGSLEIEFPIVGFNKSEIDLKIDGDYLVVKAESAKAPAGTLLPAVVKTRLPITYRFHVGKEYSLQSESISASLSNGILTVRIPKKVVLSQSIKIS